MDGAGLSDREQRALGDRSRTQGDRSLDRILRSEPRRHRTAAACLLGVVTTALLVAASITVYQPLIWAFAAAWILTVVTALPLIGQWIVRRWRHRNRAAPD